MTRWIPALLLCWVLPAAAAAEAPLFPFVISYDAPENVTNVSAWLDAPAGKDGFVRVEDGRLATDAGPIRFWGTNLCFDACFPSHEDAERVAARMARLGIGCVRMHHMDSRSIWGDSPKKTIIDPKQIERLDYLIYQLKRHGIYTDLNLHVSRWLGDAEGFPHRDQRPNYDKGLDNFEPRMIELQKEYARDLLTHVNPYTKTAYTDEPAIAFVEISNEDALFAVWGWGQLDDLPDPYAATFRKLWNAWLRKKYGTTDKLREAWNMGVFPLGDEMLENGDFSKPFGNPWDIERDEKTDFDLSVQPNGPDGKPLLRLVVRRMGEVSWRPQLTQVGLAVKQGTPYTLRFRMRSDKPRSVDVNCMMAHDPWERIGLSASAKVGPEWKEHRFTFVADRTDDNARITFTGFEPGTYELADVSLGPGGVMGLEEDQRLEDDSVPVLPKRGSSNLTEPARHDFIDFLWETEADYWWGMHKFLKEELGVKSLVSGTQLSYSPVHVQAALDYIDAHSYWNHPAFPGRPWDPRNWYIRNRALVNHPEGTLVGLAVRRVAGMAFTVSEYNHPFPNQYAAEGFPMLAAFGAFQSWDGLFPFTYSHNTDFEPRQVSGYFDIKGDTSRLAHTPACAAMFVRGDVAPAKVLLEVPVSKVAERKKLYQTQSAWNLTAAEFGVDPLLALKDRLAMQLDAQRMDAQATDARIDREKTAEFVSDTGQLRWNVAEEDAGYFIADTPRTKLFTGFIRGRTFDLGGVKLAVGQTRLDWATVSMTCVDGGEFDKPGRILIAATGLVENTGMELENLGGDRVTLGSDRWGREPLLCEGVPAEITLPVAAERVHLWPLDEWGERKAPAMVADDGGKAVIRLTPKHKTVWYEVEVR